MIVPCTSPPDYKTGFGGQFGVQTDRVDKTALGWEHNEKVRVRQETQEIIGRPVSQLQQHESQTARADYKGGNLVHGEHEQQGAVGTNYVKTRPDSKCYEF